MIITHVKQYEINI